MKKLSLLLSLVIGSAALIAGERSVDTKISDRIYALELTVQALVERVEWLTQMQENAPKVKPHLTLLIKEIDEFYGKICLSNDLKYNFSYSTGQLIGHWMVGQPVRLESAGKKGYVKMVNIDTNDWIEVQKSIY